MGIKTKLECTTSSSDKEVDMEDVEDGQYETALEVPVLAQAMQTVLLNVSKKSIINIIDKDTYDDDSTFKECLVKRKNL
eukprot:8256056-Ditylum_brightwellii.AAC.1